MNLLFITRVFTYSILPLLLAGGHMFLDKKVTTNRQRIELFLLYIFAIGVGANGIGGAYGHLFLSDLVAEGIGWPAGNPFQLEVGFANLLLGVLGFVAIHRIHRQDGFRLAVVIGVTIFSLGATLVHLLDIVDSGNLSPGNTIQNVSNLLRPSLLIGFLFLANRINVAESDSRPFLEWQMAQRPIVIWAAIGVSMGFGMGFALDAPLFWTIVWALVGAMIGLIVSKRMSSKRPNLAQS